MDYKAHETLMRKIKGLVENSTEYDEEYTKAVKKQIGEIDFITRNMITYENDTFGKYEEFMRMVDFIKQNKAMIGGRWTLQTWVGEISSSYTFNVHLNSIQINFRTYRAVFVNELVDLLEEREDRRKRYYVYDYESEKNKNKK